MAYYAPSATRSRPGFNHSPRAIGSGLLATVLWPLILIGTNLHIH